MVVKAMLRSLPCYAAAMPCHQARVQAASTHATTHLEGRGRLAACWLARPGRCCLGRLGGFGGACPAAVASSRLILLAAARRRLLRIVQLLLRREPLLVGLRQRLQGRVEMRGAMCACSFGH